MENKELINFIDWIMKNEESPRGTSFEETVSWINDLSKTEEGKEILTRLTNTYKNSDMKIFKDGGKFDYLICLQKGGKVEDCGCGKKIKNAREGSDGLRERGKVQAYSGRYPEFSTEDSTWSKVLTSEGPAYVKNIFSGNTLEQNVVTPGIHGVPRRIIREITNYDTPADADTLYRDANGLTGKRNPGFIDRLFGNVHSDKFMNRIDSILEGMEPRQLSEREVNATKHQDGGELSRRDALNILRTTGSTNKESRQEYRNAKRDAKEDGLRGKAMRKAARAATMARGIDRIMPILDDTVVIEETPIVFEDTFENLEVPTSLGVKIMEKQPTIPNDVIGGSFKEAFANARKSGLDIFEWNGKKYNTRVSDSRPYIENAIDAMGSYGDQVRPYWEIAAIGLSKK